jgi:uncharacterized membrane protein YfcA
MTVFTVLVALFIGQLVKGATGFGGSLTALPILAIVLPPGPAILVVSGTDIIAGGWLAWHARREAMPKLWWVMILPFFAGQWAGTGLLTTWPVDTTKQVLAVLVALFGLGLLLRPVREGYGEHERLPASATGILAEGFAASSVAGVIGGLVGTPGPPIVWYLRRHFVDAVSRAQMLAIFLPGSIALTLMLTARGAVGVEDWWRVVWALPAAMAGGMLGARAAGMSTPERMGRAVGVLMLAAAAGLMVS